MPRVKRTLKRREAFLIKEFLAVAGYCASNPRWTERPDAFATVYRKGQSLRIGVELTDYFNDTVAGTSSPLNPISHFCDLVLNSLFTESASVRI
jgi:hypothetical protein